MERISGLEKKYVLEVLDNQFQASKNNLFTARLETKFADMFHREFAVSFVNGTATMHTALAALGVKTGDEVIVPPLTMSSPALAVLHNGSIPVFADVDRKTFNISADSILANITEKTRAVITVALYGLAPDYDQILKICREKGIFLIEDNAQAFLSRYQGKLVGQFGDFASFSFQASKHLTCGEGGMLVTDIEALADKARKFAGLGYGSIGAKKGRIARTDIQDPNFSRHVCFGFNYRISELQSAVALGQLERAEELVGARKESAEIFNVAISDISWLIPQHTPEGCTNSYWSYSILLNVDNPEERWYQFRDLFVQNGGDGIYAAWKLTYQEPYFQNEVQKYTGVRQKYDASLCPNAEYLQKRMLQFKTNYWDLKEAEKQAEILRKTSKDFQRLI
ncbi:MAG: DegT/DnrJ/EryC1/StrS family aminotransferase [Candidatus Omnitrophica bacterium]|nr:DegT/DnrJ/EryC1/StrS family aminotransferase [Candidatus Omnitrophota bacterium]